MSLILFEIRENIGTITLNNPQKRNALSATLLNEMKSALELMEESKTHAVILRAVAGSKVWSAGLDIRELPNAGRDPMCYDDPLEKALRAIQSFPGPVIAMVTGGVWGGACDMIMTCDMVIGDPASTFAITPVKIGVPYNASGILHFISRLGLNRAKEMFFTAEPVNAQRAEQFGILNHLVPTEEIEEFTFAMARKIASHSSLSIGVIKEQFRILSEAHPLSPDTFERIQGLRRKVYDSRDYVEGIQAFLEKRQPVFAGE